MKYHHPRPLNRDRWNFRCQATTDYMRPYGWRLLEIGIFRLKPNIPDGDDAYYHVARGFWWRIFYWLPVVWGGR